MRFDFARTVRRICFAVIALALLGCGQSSQLGPEPSVLTLDEALVQVQAVDLSAMDPQAASELRASFSNMLRASGKTRFVSAVVIVGVDDFAVSDNGDGTATFHWTYLNKGDYDQNSEVNVADLTPLGAHLMHSTSDGEHDPADRVVDGDSNGEINVADLTPLGANLLNRVDGYHLEVSTDNGQNWNNVQDVPFGDSTLPLDKSARLFSVVIDHPEEPAWYRVVSYGAGMDGGASNIFEYAAGGGPGQITGLTATQGTVDGAVDISWDAHTDAVSGYDILRADSAGGTYSVIDTRATTTFTDDTVTAGVHYWYKVQGLDDVGDPFGLSAAAEGWSLVVALPPDPPANLTASDGDFSDEILLEWDASPGADMYNIWRSATPGSGHTHLIATPDTFFDDFLPAGLDYYYYVTAENANGVSGPSNEDHGFTSFIGGPPVLNLTNPPAQGSGTQFDPYLVGANTDWQFVLSDPLDGDVTLSATYTTSDIVEIWVTGDSLHVDDTPAPTFYFFGTWNGLDSNTVFFQLDASGGPPQLTIDNPPPVGSGTFADPYITAIDADYDFTLIDPVSGDVTGAGTYTVSDSNVQISGSTLLVGSTPPPDFNFYGTYNGQDSNVVYFHVQSNPSGLVIFPAIIDPNWFGVTGSGTQGDPYIMHSSNPPFNPDDNPADGICDMQFWLWAENSQGDPLDNETLDWYYVPAPTDDMVTDINNPGSKGKFRVRSPLEPFEDGYLYASDGVNDSNPIYIETNQ